MSKKLKTIAIVVAVLSLVVLSPIAIWSFLGVTYGWTEDRTFEAQWKDGFQKADQILIANGRCPTSKACSEDSVSIYVAGYAAKLPKGFKIYIYGTSDSKLLEQLSDVFVNEFNQTPDMKHLRVEAYPQTKRQDERNPVDWFLGKTVLDVNLQRSS